MLPNLHPNARISAIQRFALLGIGGCIRGTLTEALEIICHIEPIDLNIAETVTKSEIKYQFGKAIDLDDPSMVDYQKGKVEFQDELSV